MFEEFAQDDELGRRGEGRSGHAGSGVAN
jgi:hypothetical protein